MTRSLFQATILVRNYDEAIDWFTRCLGFSLRSDEDLGDGKRWVVVAPAASAGAALLLARAVGPAQTAQIGAQAGGRVAFFLQTDDFDADFDRMGAAGVQFLEKPRNEAYGKVVKFADLYGNQWDLISGGD